MKHLIAISGVVAALMAAPLPADAQSSPPPLPALTQQQSENLEARMDAYRRQTDERVVRGEITPDEAQRLVSWRQWQLAQQIASSSASSNAARTPMNGAPPADYYDSRPPTDYYDSRPPTDVYVTPPPAYGPAPVYRPYYYPAPQPYVPYAYWGPSICAGGFGHHFGGRVCF